MGLVADYRPVAFIVFLIGPPLGGPDFFGAARPLEIHITDERSVGDERSRSNR